MPTPTPTNQARPTSESLRLPCSGREKESVSYDQLRRGIDNAAYGQAWLRRRRRWFGVGVGQKQLGISPIGETDAHEREKIALLHTNGAEQRAHQWRCSDPCVPVGKKKEHRFIPSPPMSIPSALETSPPSSLFSIHHQALSVCLTERTAPNSNGTRELCPGARARNLSLYLAVAGRRLQDRGSGVFPLRGVYPPPRSLWIVGTGQSRHSYSFFLCFHMRASLKTLNQ
jgi:hypothetical protein